MCSSEYCPWSLTTHSHRDLLHSDILILYVELSVVDTVRKIGTSKVKDASGCLGILLTWYWHMHGCMSVCVPHLISLFFPNSQQKGPSYRCGAPVPSGGHLPWTPSQDHTSPASGLETPMDPILPVWKTKPHRYIIFREKNSTILAIDLNRGRPYHTIHDNRVAKWEEPEVFPHFVFPFQNCFKQ